MWRPNQIALESQLGSAQGRVQSPASRPELIVRRNGEPSGEQQSQDGPAAQLDPPQVHNRRTLDQSLKLFRASALKVIFPRKVDSIGSLSTDDSVKFGRSGLRHLRIHPF